MYRDKVAEILRKNKLGKGIILAITTLVIFFILVGAATPEKYFLKVGDIAKFDIKSPRNIENTVATEEKRKEAASRVPDQFTIKSDVAEETKQNIQHLFSKTLEIKSSNVDDIKIDDLTFTDSEKENMKQNPEQREKLIKLKRLKADSDIKLSDENFNLLISLNGNTLENLKSFLTTTLQEVYDKFQINTDHKQAQDFIDSEFNRSDFGISARELGKSIGYNLVKPNVVYDDVKTKELREEAMKAIQPDIIKENQIIVKEGEPITDQQVEILKLLGIYEEDSSLKWYIYTGLLVFIALVLSVEGFYIYKYNKKCFNNKTLILIALVQCLAVLMARCLALISPFLIPLACAPMLLCLLVEDNLSIVINVINSVFICIAVSYNIPITIMAIINAVIGTALIKNMDTRNDILYSSLYIAVVNVVLTLVLGLLQMNYGLIQVMSKCGLSLMASILSGILTLGMLPSFETIFDIVTTVKLLELSNPNQPLLKKLLMEAPGTYHHSVLVANLAELAAEAIGANSVLARVSAYYHDVGKLKRPYFFKENQVGMSNPHDKISPNLSTLIIISHVKDGIELAKEYKVPKAIQDIIKEHHGNSLVKYFYITMKNNSEKPEDIKEEDFRYPGPNPRSKEAGIIMLADGVEAAVRSIAEPTKGKIEIMVNNIIKGRLNEGYLDNCDLTLKDIEKIRKAFLKGLAGIYHERIEYPTLVNKETSEKNIKDIKKLEELEKLSRKDN